MRLDRDNLAKDLAPGTHAITLVLIPVIESERVSLSLGRIGELQGNKGSWRPLCTSVPPPEMEHSARCTADLTPAA